MFLFKIKEINEIQLDYLNIKSMCKKVENEFFFELMELFLKNKNLKEQLNNLKRDVQLNNQILNSTMNVLQQEEKNKSKLDQKCIIINLIQKTNYFYGIASFFFCILVNEIKDTSTQQKEDINSSRIVDYTHEIEVKTDQFKTEEYK